MPSKQFQNSLQKSIPLTHILFWLVAGTSIKSGGVKLVNS